MKKLLLFLVFTGLFFSCSKPDIPKSEPLPPNKYELKFKSVCTEGSTGAWYFEVEEEFYWSFLRNNSIADCDVWYSVGDVDGNTHEGYYMGSRRSEYPHNN